MDYFFKQVGNTLPIYSDTKIYVLTPNLFASGGPEALHQLVHKLNLLGYNAGNYYMLYQNEKYHTKIDGVFVNNGGKRFDYEKYTDTKIFTDIEDSNKNILICPECWQYLLDDYYEIRKCVWYLSVDYADTREYNDDFFYFAQSEYAYQFLQSKNVKNISILQDYTNLAQRVINNQVKENKISYNPRKNPDNIKNITASLNWCCQVVPLDNITHTELIRHLYVSKIIIDFGFHPGKDRVCREAALLGCCVITNKKGSASNDIDVEIPNEYKVDPYDTQKTVEKIIFCLNNYENEIKKFKKYFDKVSIEEKEFEYQIQSIFIKEN